MIAHQKKIHQQLKFLWVGLQHLLIQPSVSCPVSSLSVNKMRPANYSGVQAGTTGVFVQGLA